MVVAGKEIRISPVDLRASQTRTLRRLAPRAVWREPQKQLLVPMQKGPGAADDLLAFVRELWEEDPEN
jgi:transcription-repair coupling factor (superfamily II helicase)